MAALGTITHIHTPRQDSPSPLYPISDYDIQRGRPLGTITVRPGHTFQPVLRGPVSDYVVRQIRVLYRQLWPSHGQRFPQ
jgi:hypothetical protein